MGPDGLRDAIHIWLNLSYGCVDASKRRPAYSSLHPGGHRAAWIV